MPRFTAPPPSGEVSITLQKPFNGIATKKIEIFGEPNSSATIKAHNHAGGKEHTMLSTVGEIQEDDFTSLLDGIQQVRGFPSDPNSDIYGFDTRVVFTTFDVQWGNGQEVEEAELSEETKEAFKAIVDRIEELGRKYAKKDAAI